MPLRAACGVFLQEAGLLSGTPSPSCGARRMAETAALLADEVFPDVPLRQWVISFPFPLRYLFAAHPQAMLKVLGIVYRAVSTHLIHKAGLKREVAPARRGKGPKAIDNTEVKSLVEHHAARACPVLSGMTRAQRLKRVFTIDIPRGTFS